MVGSEENRCFSGASVALMLFCIVPSPLPLLYTLGAPRLPTHAVPHFEDVHAI